MADDFVLTYTVDGILQEHPLQRERTLVGRAQECDLCFPYNTELSRLHATLVASEDALSVEDVCSRSGTFVNGFRVQGSRRLDDGDKIRIGRIELQLRRRLHGVDTVDFGSVALEQPLPDRKSSPTQTIGIGDEIATSAAAAAATESGDSVPSVNHYEVLGLPPFESDARKIQQAANERIRQLRTAGSPVGEQLDAVTRALACLTDPQRKLAYDRDLAEGQGLDYRIHEGRVVARARPTGTQALAGIASLAGFALLFWLVSFLVGGRLVDSLAAFFRALSDGRMPR